MDRTIPETVYDTWNRIPYPERIQLSNQYHLKRSGVISVVNKGNGQSQVVSDGFLMNDLAIFDEQFMKGIVGEYADNHTLVVNFFKYSLYGKPAIIDSNRSPDASTISSGGTSEGAQGASVTSGTSVQVVGGQDSGTDGNNPESSVGSTPVLQTPSDEIKDLRRAVDRLEQSVPVEKRVISEAERMANTPPPEKRKGKMTSEAAKAIWARRKAKQNSL